MFGIPPQVELLGVRFFFCLTLAVRRTVILVTATAPDLVCTLCVPLTNPSRFLFCINIILGNISLRFIPVSFMQTIKVAPCGWWPLATSSCSAVGRPGVHRPLPMGADAGEDLAHDLRL